MMALGPSHLTAARSSSVSLWCLAHRTKFPALWWAVGWSWVSQLSRSPCRALRRVRWWAASQSSSVMAALTCCWTAVAWTWVAGRLLLRARSRRSRCQMAYRCRTCAWGWPVMVAVIQRSTRTRCSSRAGSVLVATRIARRCSTGLLKGSSSRPVWVRARCPAPSSASTTEALLLFSQLAMVLGRWLLARFSYRPCSSARTSPPPPSSSRSRSRRTHRTQGWVPNWSWPQPGQDCQNDGSGRVHVAHSGAVRVPPRIGLTSPQLAHRAQRCRQAVHQGCPVALEIFRAADRPQIEQVIIVADGSGATVRARGHSPAPCHHGSIQGRLDVGDQLNHINRLGRRHASALRAGDTGAFGAQLPHTDAGCLTARGLRPGGGPPDGHRLDQLAHRTVEDVQQRHEHLQAESFRSIDDQPVDLAGGQTDSSCGQGWDQVGGGEHPAAGHHLAKVPPVVEFACHQDSLLLPARHV